MILKRLKVQTTLGEATNCYIVEDEETKETMVIDPGGEADKILEMLDIRGKCKIHLFNTLPWRPHWSRFRGKE